MITCLENHMFTFDSVMRQVAFGWTLGLFYSRQTFRGFGPHGAQRVSIHVGNEGAAQ